MTDDALSPPQPDEQPDAPSPRRRDALIRDAATSLIALGNRLPRLKSAGYKLYGAATRYLPRGRHVAKLGEVGQGVWRGAQPSLRAFRTLRELGVDTVINLRPESDYEGPHVRALGMHYLHFPLPPLDAPTLELTVSFLSLVTDPANGTVFFHCFHGVDRTGTMAACLRIARDGWSAEAAIDEMRAYKVHERGQHAKLAFVRRFEEAWQALPESERRRILHRPEPGAPAPEAAPGPWDRAKAWARRAWRRLRGAALPALALWLCAAPARADVELWTPVEARGSLGAAPGGWAPTKLRAIVEARQKLDGAQGSQVFLRTGPIWELGNGHFLALHGAAAFARGAPDQPWGLERRLEVEPNFLWRLPALALSLADRNRLELRSLASGELRWRYRNQLRLNYTGFGGFAPFAWDEVLYDLSGAGFNQNRLAAGIALVPAPGRRVDLGVLLRHRRADASAPWDADVALWVQLFADPGPTQAPRPPAV